MSRKYLTISLLAVVALAIGIFVLQSHNSRAKSARIESEILKELTAEDIKAVLTTQSGDAPGEITESTESRKLFLKGMREYLALASQARREGLSDQPVFKVNFEHKKKLLLADMYSAKIQKENGSPIQISEAEIDGVWADPENVRNFETDMEALRSIQAEVAKERGDQAPISKLAGGALLKARKNWARVNILSIKAIADNDLMSRPETVLRLKILEAGILSSDYLRKHWANKIKASEEEIAAYLGSHPELNQAKKRDKAEDILQKAKAGEDFAKLAGEFSEDRISKTNGGLYKDISKDVIWAEVEAAALSMENGSVGPAIVESATGFHIVKLENKKTIKDKDGQESITFSVRHILLQRNFEDPGHANPSIPAPFLTANEIAKTAIEKDKRALFVEQTIQLNPIVLPEDFSAALRFENRLA